MSVGLLQAQGVVYSRCYITHDPEGGRDFKFAELVHRTYAEDDVNTLFLYTNSAWEYDPETDEIKTFARAGAYLAIDFVKDNWSNLTGYYYSEEVENYGYIENAEFDELPEDDGEWANHSVDYAELQIVWTDNYDGYNIFYRILCEEDTEDEFALSQWVYDVCLISEAAKYPDWCNTTRSAGDLPMFDYSSISEFIDEGTPAVSIALVDNLDHYMRDNGAYVSLGIILHTENRNDLRGTYSSEDGSVNFVNLVSVADDNNYDLVSGADPQTVIITLNEDGESYDLQYDLILTEVTLEEIRSVTGHVYGICDEQMHITEGVEPVLQSARTSHKMLHNGQLLIESNGRIYNAIGAELK